MKLGQKGILWMAGKAAIEANLLVFPIVTLVFFPFIRQYRFIEIWQDWYYSGLLALGFGISITIFVLIPATFLFEKLNPGISQAELAGKLNMLSLVLLIVATLVYKGFSKPGPQGRALLFAGMMAIMFIAWAFTTRYKDGQLRNGEVNQDQKEDGK